MSHVREQIAVALVARLTGLTTTGGRVFRQRPTEMLLQGVGELPALRIFCLGDQATPLGIGSPLYDRIVLFRIEGTVQMALGAPGTSNPVDTLLNLIASEVETALGVQLALDFGSVSTPIYQGCEFSDGVGDQTIGVVSMRFDFGVMSQQGAPDVAISSN